MARRKRSTATAAEVAAVAQTHVYQCNNKMIIMAAATTKPATTNGIHAIKVKKAKVEH